MAPGNNELTFYVTLQIKPEKVDDWLLAVNDIAEHMAKEEAFICCYLQRDLFNPCTFTLFEQWREESMETFLANQMKPYRYGYESKLPEYLQSPRQAAILTPVKTWLAAG
jgi:quinol monooxygenase YgiN